MSSNLKIAFDVGNCLRVFPSH